MRSESALFIRPAGPQDCEVLAGLHHLSHTTSFAEFAAQSWLEARRLEQYMIFWCEYLADQPTNERTWLAEIEGEATGTVTIMSLANSSDSFRSSSLTQLRDDEIACLRLMYVHPQHMRRGIGRELVGRAANFAQEQDYQAITLITHAANESARAFYQRMGWDLEEVFSQQVEEFFDEPPRMRKRARYVRILDP